MSDQTNFLNQPRQSILYAKPSITSREIKYVTDAVTNGWGEHCYDYLIRFRKELESHFGVSYAFPTSSCHGALHIVLSALNVGPGDEVIVPDITWVGSVAPIVWLGASPVFVDVLPDTWCIDPQKVVEAITPRTKAIVVVHVYGNMAAMDDVLRISKEHKIPVIEDAAEAIGSEYRGQKAGSIADAGVFSFHGTKTMTTGEGGAILCSRDDLAERIDVLENQGRKRGEQRHFWCEQIGFKYKMSNIQAALGLAQAERLDELVERKRRIFSWYQEALADLPDISLNIEPSDTRNGYWMPTVVFGPSHHLDRDALIREMNEERIAVRPFFYPVSSMPMFESCDHNAVSYGLSARGINLPSCLDLEKADVEEVVASLRVVLASHSSDRLSRREKTRKCGISC